MGSSERTSEGEVVRFKGEREVIYPRHDREAYFHSDLATMGNLRMFMGVRDKLCIRPGLSVIWGVHGKATEGARRGDRFNGLQYCIDLLFVCVSLA